MMQTMRDVKNKLTKRDYKYIDSPAGAINLAGQGTDYLTRMSKRGGQMVKDYDTMQGTTWINLPAN